MSTLALVYEISGNPLFSSTASVSTDRLSEFAQPYEVNDLLQQLERAGHKVTIVDGPHGLLEQREELAASGAYIFNKSIGFGGLERKIHVPSICLLFGLPLIGSTAYSMTLARHKYHTNRLLAGLGYLVPNSILWTPEDRPSLERFRFPVIAKPNHESDSLGIDEHSISNDMSEASDRATLLHERFKQPIVVEEYIPGEEWKVSIVGNGHNIEALGCVSVARDGQPIEGSLQTRSDVVESTLSYLPVADGLLSEAVQVACRIHNDLGLRDYSRCDFRIGSDGSLVCMEVSTHPDISSTSSFMAAATAGGREVFEVLDAIVAAAHRRHESTLRGS